MSVAASVRLSPHFTTGELGADNPAATAFVLANLARMATYLESVRVALGNRPVTVTSGFRPPAHNAAVGGVNASSHLVGLAADVTVAGLSLRATYDALAAAAAAGQLPPWDQIIYYPIEGHVHVGIAPPLRREVRIRLFEGSGGTPLLTADTLNALGNNVASAFAGAVTHSQLLGVGVALLFLFVFLY